MMGRGEATEVGKRMVGVGSTSHRTVLGPGGGEEEKAAAARDWLEKTASKVASNVGEAEAGGFFAPLTLWGLKVLRTGGGGARCVFKVPNYLTDGNGNWRAGAIASLIDNVGATAIVSELGELKISVDFSIAYFAPAKVGEEVEIEGNVCYNVGKLSSVVVEIRKKGSGELVAVGRQWMSTRPSRI